MMLVGRWYEDYISPPLPQSSFLTVFWSSRTGNKGRFGISVECTDVPPMSSGGSGIDSSGDVPWRSEWACTPPRFGNSILKPLLLARAYWVTTFPWRSMHSKLGICSLIKYMNAVIICTVSHCHFPNKELFLFDCNNKFSVKYNYVAGIWPPHKYIPSQRLDWFANLTLACPYPGSHAWFRATTTIPFLLKVSWIINFNVCARQGDKLLIWLGFTHSEV